MTLRLGGDGAITGCTSLENPDLTVSGLTISGSFDAEKVLVASGTAAAPSYTFSGDTDNGLYYAGTNSIGLSTAGTSAILIDSASNVGIGTTSPDSLLDLEFANSRMRFEQESGSNRPVIRGTRTSDKANRALSIGGSDISFLIGSTATAALTSADEKVRIDSSGRLLVGTSSDFTNGTGTKLQSVDTAGGQLAIGRNVDTVNTGNLVGRIRWYSNVGGTSEETARISVQADGNYALGDKPGRLVFSTTADGESSPTERMRITSDGNVRIGTTDTGTAKLRFDNATDTTPSDINKIHLFNNGGTIVGFGISSGQLNYKAPAHVFHLNNNSEAMRINNLGDVGVGTTAPTYYGGNFRTLEVAGSAGNDGGIFSTVTADNVVKAYFYTESTNDTANFGTVTNHPLLVRTNSVERMRIDSAGLISVNTADGSADGYLLNLERNTQVLKVDCNGTGDVVGAYFRHARGGLAGFSGKMISFVGNDGTEEGSIVISTTTTAYNTSSDYRRKENQQLIADGIQRVKNLKPYRFNFIKHPEAIVDGFFAHEVQGVVPEAITGQKDAVDADNNPIYQGIDQSKLVPLLTAALQEAIAKIETLEVEVAALKAQ